MAARAFNRSPERKRRDNVKESPIAADTIMVGAGPCACPWNSNYESGGTVKLRLAVCVKQKPGAQATG